jgi:hypothetical protein
MSGGKYTWSNNQENPTLERLDRFLVSKTWGENLPLVIVNKLPRVMANHNPLILTLNQIQTLSKLSFKFELTWVKHPEFMQKVKEIWDASCHAESAFDRIQMKLKKIKQYFKGWGLNSQGENKKKKCD